MSESKDVDELLSIVPLLPPQAVLYLTQQPLAHQEMVVRQIASMLKYWEVNHVDLDPIQREFVLNAVVVSLNSIALGFTWAVADVVGAHRRPGSADQDSPGLHEEQGSG